VAWVASFVNEYPRTHEAGERTHGGTDQSQITYLVLISHAVAIWNGQYRKPDVLSMCHITFIHVGACNIQTKQFRHHGQFIFQAFGVLQKCQMCAFCLFAGCQRRHFLQHQSTFQSLTPPRISWLLVLKKIQKGAFFKPHGQSTTQPIVYCPCPKLWGTDESRIKIRGQIRGMNIMKGPPSLWITINPLDMGDPIAQVLVGEQIDLDSFEHTAGPNSEQQNLNIAHDPFAVAKFFHFVIGTILEELFGIKGYSNGSHVRRTNRIFGKVASYVGTVEAQGQGTLYLHIVVWLVGALTHVQMKEAFKSETFRVKVKNYIKANICADLDGADKQTVLHSATQPAISYSRPVDPLRTWLFVFRPKLQN